MNNAENLSVLQEDLISWQFIWNCFVDATNRFCLKRLNRKKELFLNRNGRQKQLLTLDWTETQDNSSTYSQECSNLQLLSVTASGTLVLPRRASTQSAFFLFFAHQLKQQKPILWRAATQHLHASHKTYLNSFKNLNSFFRRFQYMELILIKS